MRHYSFSVLCIYVSNILPILIMGIKPMKKPLLIIGIVALLVCVGLSGCNQVSNTLNPEKGKFIGTWKVEKLNNSTISGEVYTFFSDGTVRISAASGTWELKDGKLVLEFEMHQSMYSYSFSNNDRTLIWIMDNKYTVELEKQAEIC